MEDVASAELRRCVVLPRVTSAPSTELFSTAEVRSTAALAAVPDKVVAEPVRRRLPKVAEPEEPDHARTGLVLLGVLAGAPLVWFSLGDSGTEPAASRLRPGAVAGTPGPPTGPADPAVTPSTGRTEVPDGKKSASAGAAAPAKSGGAAHPRFSAVVGPGCFGSGTYDRIGYYTDGRSGWLAGSGGYSGAGCDGRFDALPMSGTTSGDDPGLWARWTFYPGPLHKCAVAVYIPKNSSRVYVGGDPAHYSIHLVSDNSAVTGFHVYQWRTLGRWVDARSFTARSAFYVRLDNTGKDWSGEKKTYAHVAAAQVRATCH